MSLVLQYSTGRQVESVYIGPLSGEGRAHTDVIDSK